MSERYRLRMIFKAKKRPLNERPFYVENKTYLLRRTATKPANAEPNNHAAAGTGTAEAT